MVRISVIIPTFNRAKILLPRAIQSVLNQTFREFELIVVDDCSTDETEEIVREFNDERIIYFKRSKNGGIGVARNDGIRLAKAPYVTFLDSDDEYLAEYLSHAVACMDQSDDSVGFCWGAYTIQEDIKGKETTVFWNPQKPYGYADFLMGLKIGAGVGVTVKRDCFEKVGLFDESLRVSEDTDFFLRLVKNYTFTTFVGSFVIVHSHKEERIRDNMAMHAEAYGKILENHKEAIFSKRELTERWIYKLMWLNYHAGRITVGNSYLKKLFYYRIGSTKSLVVSIMFNILPGSWARKIHKSFTG